LKSLNRPSGDGDGGQGLLDALQDIQDKLRNEFNEKLDNLLKRLESLEQESRDKDTDLQDQIDNLNKLFDKL
jgi:ABC-type transporter Mla subunit MlaD